MEHIQLNAENIAGILMGLAIFIKQFTDSHSRKIREQAAIERANEIKAAIGTAIDDLQKWANNTFMKRIA